MQDDGLHKLFFARVACMLGVALGEEADGFAAGAANWDGPVAIGVCDIFNQNKVWAKLMSPHIVGPSRVVTTCVKSAPR